MDILIKKKLLEISEPQFQKFTKSLSPDAPNVLGTRIPALRAYARELAQSEKAYEIINDANDSFMEETLLRGFIICNISADYAEKLRLTAKFVPQISSWAICDSFCAEAKFCKKDLPQTWEFIKPYLQSPNEYEVRFGAVMMLDYFILPEKLDEMMALLAKVCHKGYYAKMAVAWAYSICCAKFPTETIAFLKNNKLDDFTYKKAIQKSIESFRVSPENKQILRNMRG